MVVVDIATLIPPPAIPIQVGSLADWQAVEQELGVTFPTDFREFIFKYGTGYLGSFYSVWNPFWSSNKFVESVRLICAAERESQGRFPEFFPYAIYPDSPGFLPWGSDDNGNYYGWLTEGSADEWSVLSNEVRGLGYRLHCCTMTEYLAKVFGGEIRPLCADIFGPDDFIFRV